MRWVSWDMLMSPELVKRQVFKATLYAHAGTLARLAAGEPWTKLCAEQSA